jgi:(1->4)-alpha-D-glucan 1-alpha-D-glucosylmutase
MNPQSTYRLQFHAGFTFRDAAAITPYLQALGISHVYASPYLMAAAGSTHGYDVINHARLNPELGTQSDFDAWMAALNAAGMSHILDIVPNHAGVATNDNPWWNDVLEHGPAGEFGNHFDISWRGSPRPQMHDRVLLPLLGAPYGQTLEEGQLRVTLDPAAGRLQVHYFERKFPLDPRSYPVALGPAADALSDFPERQELQALLAAFAALPSRSECEGDKPAARRSAAAALYPRLARWLSGSSAARHAVDRALETLNGQKGDPRSFDRLDALLQDQAYRLAYWRTATDEINYRRFFDINDLAAVRMELPAVFDAAHQLPLQLIQKGLLTGLRIDHPDGLFDPKAYLQRLQDAYRRLQPSTEKNERLYVVVEKILAAGEDLRTDWPVAGTSGYDFLNHVSSLFVDPAGEGPLTQTYANWIGREIHFDQLAYEKKKWVLENALASELTMLTHRLDLLAQRFRDTRDFTLRGLREALRETIACFPTYRTYITAAPVSDEDRRRVTDALHTARRRNPSLDSALFDFLQRTLLLEFPPTATDADKAAQIQWVGRFQQLTSPVTAKGIEDTAFYLYHRLISLNEVGGEPARFGVSPDALHAYFADRAEKWPYALSALSTHDTKRSEDVRARIHVLSELPDQWQHHLTQWRSALGDTPVDPNDTYLLLQTLLGAWPDQPLTAEGREAFTTRIQAYMKKALREGKQHTSWTDPNPAYESAVDQLVERLTDPAQSREFLDTFLPFQKTLAHAGLLNSVGQTLLRLLAPGVPDTYQGSELLDLSLVDPDNRRPVDYPRRKKLLDALPTALADASTALAALKDGRLKLLLVHRALTARRRNPALFTIGTYLPATTTGPRARHLFAFARRHQNKTALIALPRLTARFLTPDRPLPIADLWESTRLHFPGATGRYTNLLTGETLHTGDGTIDAKSLFTRLPIAVLISE